MTDPARRVADLLRLAASTHSEAEAASVAVKAAKLFVDKKLSIEAEKGPVTCPLCAPVSPLGGGICKSCGYRGLGPGHACTSRDPSVVCEVHRTWPVPGRAITVQDARSIAMRAIAAGLAEGKAEDRALSNLRSRLIAAERERDELRRRLAEIEAATRKNQRRNKKATKETTIDERR